MDPGLHIPDNPTSEDAEEVLKALPEMRCVYEGTAPIIIARIKPKLPPSGLDLMLRAWLDVDENWSFVTGPTCD